MKELNLKAKVTNKRYNSYKGQIGKICSNHLMVKTIKNDKELIDYLEYVVNCINIYDNMNN